MWAFPPLELASWERFGLISSSKSTCNWLFSPDSLESSTNQPQNTLIHVFVTSWKYVGTFPSPVDFSGAFRGHFEPFSGSKTTCKSLFCKNSRFEAICCFIHTHILVHRMFPCYLHCRQAHRAWVWPSRGHTCMLHALGNVCDLWWQLWVTRPNLRWVTEWFLNRKPCIIMRLRIKTQRFSAWSICWVVVRL